MLALSSLASIKSCKSCYTSKSNTIADLNLKKKSNFNQNVQVPGLSEPIRVTEGVCF
jgi:hypothetical protein